MRLSLENLKNQPIFTWLIFLLLGFLFYGRSLNIFFLSDDWHWLWLSKNAIWSGQMFWSNYEGTLAGGSYNPLLVILFKTFFSFFGLKWAYFHALTVIIHSVNAFLVYILSKKFVRFFRLNLSLQYSWLTAVLFLIWPTQVEAIVWLASWPHLWATTFYLLALISYFHCKEVLQKKYFICSLLFFILALLTKEIALSFPLLVLFLEIYQQSKNNLEKKARWLGSYLLLIWIIALIFLLMRFYSTQTFFGYYGQNQLPFSLSLWLANLTGYINDLVGAAYSRVLFFKIWYKDMAAVAIFTATALALYFYLLLRAKKLAQFSLFFIFLISLWPVLPLGLNRLNFEGERYLYLPSIFFLSWLVYLFFSHIKRQFWQRFILFFLILGSSFIVWQKVGIWQQAGAVAQNIVQSVAALSLDDNQEVVTAGLPDNFSGAQVFRNNLEQALAFHYPEKNIKIWPLPIYTRLDQNNFDKNLLKWREDERGWFAESIDGGPVVTGITSVEKYGFYWELWNYNYQNYTANTIRLMPQSEDLKNKLTTGQLKLLIYDQGVLQILE